MSASELAVVFLVAFFLLLAVNGYLAWRLHVIEKWIRAVINAGYRKDKDEEEDR